MRTSGIVPIIGTATGAGVCTPATVKAEATVETALALTQAQNELIREACCYGRMSLRVAAANKVLSPSFTVDALQGSFDGTNFVTLQSFAPLAVTANGELGLIEIVTHLPRRLTHLKVLITVTTLDSSNYLDLLLALMVES